MGALPAFLPELMDIESYELSEPEQQQDGTQLVHASVQTGRGAAAEFTFVLAKKTIGKKKGSLMTRTLRRREQAA